MKNTREQTEKSFVADIKWIVQLPIHNVVIRHWTDKMVFPATKITVYAGFHSVILEDIPGNTSSLDVVVDGKPFWVTGQKNFNELVNIRDGLLKQYDTKTKE